MSTALTAPQQHGTLLEAISAQEQGFLDLFRGDKARLLNFKATVLNIVLDGGLTSVSTESILASAITAANYGLIPANGHGWLIPRRNKKKGVTECCFQLGYRGLVVLLARVGILASSTIVYHGENLILEDDGVGLIIKHLPNPDNKEINSQQHVRCGFARFYVQGHPRPFAHLSTIGEIQRAMESSEAWTKDGAGNFNKKNHGAWHTDFSEMCRRVPLLRGAKYLPIEDPMVAQALADAEYTMFETIESTPIQTAYTHESAPGTRFQPDALAPPQPNLLDDMHKAFFARITEAKEAGLVVLTREEVLELAPKLQACETTEAMETVFKDFTKVGLPPVTPPEND